MTVLYFCHLFAAASLVLMIAGFEIAQNWRLEHHDLRKLVRRAGIAALTYVPAALAFLFLKPRGGDEGGVRVQPDRHHGRPVRKPDAAMPSTRLPMSCPPCCSLAWSWRWR